MLHIAHPRHSAESMMPKRSGGIAQNVSSLFRNFHASYLGELLVGAAVRCSGLAGIDPDSAATWIVGVVIWSASHSALEAALGICVLALLLPSWSFLQARRHRTQAPLTEKFKTDSQSDYSRTISLSLSKSSLNQAILKLAWTSEPAIEGGDMSPSRVFLHIDIPSQMAGDEMLVEVDIAGCPGRSMRVIVEALAA